MLQKLKEKVYNSWPVDNAYRTLWFFYKKLIHPHTLDKNNTKINIGAGRWIRNGWITLDYYDFWYKDIYMKNCDINHNLMSFKPLPIKTNSVGMLFSSHCIEHIPEKFYPFLYKEFHRILKKGGVFRNMVPDFDIMYDDLLKGLSNNYDQEKIRYFFYFFCKYFDVKKMDLNKLKKEVKSLSKEDFADNYLAKVPYSWMKKHPGSHKSWWNYAKMSKMLKDVGFSKVYRSYPFKSKFKEFRSNYQFLNMGFDGTHPERSLIVEAVK
ncbi:MAG: methyltransferase domain-containing protein [archaeon]